MKVLVSDPISELGVAKLKERVEVDVKTDLTPEELVKVIGDYDALIVRSQTQVTAEVIKAGEKLKVIGRAGVGVDNIDVAAATQNGVMVVNAPAGNTIATAEHSMAMMLSLVRNIPSAYFSLKSKE
ncbi:MAG: phosphoglycerate dehydrogenase, partial [Firmicutes bacterium HGW-Firmicutes-13]